MNGMHELVAAAFYLQKKPFHSRCVKDDVLVQVRMLIYV